MEIQFKSWVYIPHWSQVSEKTPLRWLFTLTLKGKNWFALRLEREKNTFRSIYEKSKQIMEIHGTFSLLHFWLIKGVYFLRNANNLNFKLFFRLYTSPTKQVFCLYLRRILDNESFWMLSKSTFLAFKKSCTSCPNWGEGVGGEIIWTKFKRTAAFFREIFPYVCYDIINRM